SWKGRARARARARARRLSLVRQPLDIGVGIANLSHCRSPCLAREPVSSATALPLAVLALLAVNSFAREPVSSATALPLAVDSLATRPEESPGARAPLRARGASRSTA